MPGPITAIELEELLCKEWEETLTLWLKDYQIQANLLRRVRHKYEDDWEIKLDCDEMLWNLERIMEDTKAEILLENKQLEAIRKVKSEQYRTG